MLSFNVLIFIVNLSLKCSNFPFQKGNKEISKNFRKYTSITNCWLILSGFCDINFYFLLNIIRTSLCSQFVLIFLPNLSFDVLTKSVLIKKSVFILGQTQPPAMFLKISQNSEENTCTGVFFLIKLQAWDTDVFLWILRNFQEQLWWLRLS